MLLDVWVASVMVGVASHKDLVFCTKAVGGFKQCEGMSCVPANILESA